MKSQVLVYFNEWLTLMDKAFYQLSAEEFSQLEDKIRKEIAVSRRNRKKRK